MDPDRVMVSGHHQIVKQMDADRVTVPKLLRILLADGTDRQTISITIIFSKNVRT